MIPFLDLAADFAEVEADARRRIDGVLARQQFVLGPETAALEAAMRERLGAASAVAVSSGSDALSLALLALGIGPGDAVVVPAFTFFATAGAVARAGATPVFCDVDRGSFLAGAAEMRVAIERGFRREGGALRHVRDGSRLAALLPVHLYGRAVRMDGVLALAAETGARVVEDAAQAIDSRDRGRAVGTIGDAGCFSFYPTKNLGGPGDGGLVACRDEALGARLAGLRTHGAAPGGYLHEEAGVNARMAELVAAVLVAKLARLDAWNAARRRVAATYDEALAGAASAGLLELPSKPAPGGHAWHQYAVRIGGGRRDRVKAALEAEGIPSRVFYPLPLHLQPCFASLGGAAGDLPESEAAAAEVLCLPIYPSLRGDDARRAAGALVRAARTA